MASSNILTVFIRSVADLAGFAKTEAAQKRLQEQASETAVAVKAAVAKPAGAEDADKTIAEMRAQFAGLQKGIDNLKASQTSAVPSTKSLGTALKGLGSSLVNVLGGVVGVSTLLVGAGAAAYLWYHDRVEAARKKIIEFNEAMAENKRAAEESRIEALAGQYDILRKNIGEASDEQERINAARAVAAAADKAVRLAEIDMAEKEALAGMPAGDKIGRDKVKAGFAEQRRALETQTGIASAEADAADRRRKLDESRQREETYAKDIAAQTDELTALEQRRREIEERIADVSGTGAPMRQEDISVMGPGGVPIKTGSRSVVDKVEQERVIAALRLDLTGTKDKPGIDANYKKVAASLAEARASAAKQETETRALTIEADAYDKRLLGIRRTAPRIDAAEAAIERSAISESEAKEDERRRKEEDKAFRKGAPGRRYNDLDEQKFEIQRKLDESRATSSRARERQSNFRPGMTWENGRIVTKQDIDDQTQKTLAAQNAVTAAALAALQRIEKEQTKLAAQIRNGRGND